MPKIEIEISKVMTLEQEFAVANIIDNAVAKLNYMGLRVLQYNYPKKRTDDKKTE